MKQTTIKDIAKASGVSITTVSRALNGNYPVSMEVQERVRKAVQELEYRPNAVARSLRSNRTNLIALVVPDLSNLFFMEAAKGLEREIAADGYNLVVAGSDGKAEKERHLLESLLERRIDALVIASSDSRGDSIRRFIELRVPVVQIDRILDGLETNQVGWDNTDASRRITQVLVDAGHTDIGIVNVSLKNRNGQGRYYGFVQAMEENGLAVEEEWVSPSNFDGDSAYLWVREALARPYRPTALFCANNIVLAGTLKACAELDLQIGKDISLVSFGMIESYFGLRITCMYQDSCEMGRQAGRLLQQSLRLGTDGGCTKIRLEAEFRQGDSVRELRRR